MNSSAKETSNAGYYFGVLQNLNADSKLDLISQLSQSLKSDKTDNSSLESLFGAYKSEETADEIISEIRSSRISNRNIEPL
jgi:cell shape-determining protein MreC